MLSFLRLGKVPNSYVSRSAGCRFAGSILYPELCQVLQKEPERLDWELAAPSLRSTLISGVASLPLDLLPNLFICFSLTLFHPSNNFAFELVNVRSRIHLSFVQY